MVKTQSEEMLAYYDEATQLFADYFARKYFGLEGEVDWVAGEVGGVAVIGDYFFSVADMHNYIKYKYSRALMFEYYDYALEAHEKSESPINIKNWRKSLREKE